MSYHPIPSSRHSITLLPNGKYTYAYGPSGFRGLFYNRSTLFYAAFASLGGLTFGYDQGVIATVLVMKDFVAKFPIDAWQKGVMTAVLELGALIGSICAGTLSERVSRTGAICIACVIFCIGSSFQTFATRISQIILGRAVGGVGVGALSMLCPLYLAEISPPEMRGTIMVIEQFSIVLGVVVGYWLGFFTRNLSGSSSWRIPLGLQLLPGLLLAIGCLKLPPSPRLLILRGQEEAGIKALKRLRIRTNHTPTRYSNITENRSEDREILENLIKLETLEIKVEAQLIHDAEAKAPGALNNNTRKSSFSKEFSLWLKLFDALYIRRVMVGVMIMVFQQWSGVNALIYYAPSLMRALGFDPNGNAILIAAGFVSITQFVAVFPAMGIVDRVGRRPLLMFGSAVMAASHAIIALLTWSFQSTWSQHRIATWMAVGCVYLFTFAYGTSFGPVGWVLPSEVIPLEIRGRGVALSTASNWANNFVIGLITPTMLETSPSFTYIIFGVACLLACAWSKYKLPETANVSLEDMGAVFGHEGPQGRKRAIEEELGLQTLIRELTEVLS